MKKISKALVAALFAPLVPVIAHYLHVGPEIAESTVWYLFILGEAGALGVWRVPNAA